MALPDRRSSILLASVLAAAALGFAGSWWKSPTRGRQELEPTATVAVVEETQVDLEGGERSPVHGAVSAVTIEVVDSHANSVLDALVTLESIDTGGGEGLERPDPRPKLAPATWEDVEPGRWRASLKSPRHLPASYEFELAEGEALERRFEVLGHGRISGRVVSTIGRPVPGLVFFLTDGQSHPGRGDDTGELLTARPDDQGRFSMVIETEADISVSFGFPGRPVASDPSRQHVGPGIELQCEVVVPSSAVVELNLQGSPPGGEVGRRAYVVARLQVDTSRPEANWIAPDSSPVVISETKDSEGLDTRPRSVPFTPPSPTDTEDPWRTVTSRNMPLDGKATVESVSPGFPYRLLIEFGEKKYTSKQTFRLNSGLVTRLSADLGSLPEGQNTGEFFLEVEDLASKVNLPPGVVWK